MSDAAEAHGVLSVQTAPLPAQSGLCDALHAEIPAYGPRPNYLQSSQAQHWMYSPAELTRMRQAANQQAASALAAFAKESGVREEELAIIRFYLLRIGRLVRAFQLPSLVESTAMTLMKRFYLRNSCMQFHPKLIMLTSIYLASKAENYPLPLSRFCAQVNESAAGKPPPQQPSAARGDVTENIIKDLEFGMVQSLDFELGVHGAHRALYGLILDFQTLESPLQRDDLMAYAGAVQSFVQVARLTDAEFIYAPPHIALASCWMCDAPRAAGGTTVGKDVVHAWLAAKAKAGAAHRQEQRALRETWRAKQKAVRDAAKKATEQDEPDKKAEAPAPVPQAPTAPVELSAEEIEKDGLGIPQDELEGILEEVAQLIRSVAPDAPPGTPLRPSVDMEQVKKIDLALRSCLTLFESGQSSSAKKRSAQDDEGSAKRQRTDTNGPDSDDDL